jgi:hypothetical protein
MNKLTINLTVQELKIMTNILNYVLTSHDINDLRKNHLNIYLYLSCIYDFYTKLDKKNQEVASFGFTPGKPIKIALKRHEALAFYSLVTPEDPEADSLLPAIPTQTESLIQGIMNDIHKHYLA